MIRVHASDWEFETSASSITKTGHVDPYLVRVDKSSAGEVMARVNWEFAISVSSIAKMDNADPYSVRVDGLADPRKPLHAAERRCGAMRMADESARL